MLILVLLGFEYVPDPDHPLSMCRKCGQAIDENVAVETLQQPVMPAAQDKPGD
jgi:hypothetical protein